MIDLVEIVSDTETRYKLAARGRRFEAAATFRLGLLGPKGTVTSDVSLIMARTWALPIAGCGGSGHLGMSACSREQ